MKKEEWEENGPLVSVFHSPFSVDSLFYSRNLNLMHMGRSEAQPTIASTSKAHHGPESWF